jgi:hypothetical protein
MWSYVYDDCMGEDDADDSEEWQLFFLWMRRTRWNGKVFLSTCLYLSCGLSLWESIKLFRMIDTVNNGLIEKLMKLLITNLHVCIIHILYIINIYLWVTFSLSIFSFECVLIIQSGHFSFDIINILRMYKYVRIILFCI